MPLLTTLTTGSAAVVGRLRHLPGALGGRRALRLGGQALVVTALVGGTAVYAAADSTVTLSVDGEQQDVRTFGGTVESVLDKAGVELGERDVVAPALTTPVTDGGEVVVRHARELRLTVDGEEQTIWTTALTVDEALADADVRAAGATLSASRSQRLGREGLDLRVATPKDVTVLVDGETLDVTTDALDVAEVLAEAGVTLGEHDRLSVPAASPAVDGLVVAVTRVSSAQDVVTESVDFETEERETDDLYEGERRVATEGAPGERTIVRGQVLANGQVLHARVTSDEVTTAPVTRVVLVGTKERPAPEPEPEPEPASSSSSSSSGSSSSGSSGSSGSSAPAVPSGSVWDRLAECESGGNWSINTGNGYYGGLQFSASSWRAVGGTGLPHEHSRETQIQMGEKLQAIQGWGAWPACSAKLGLR